MTEYHTVFKDTIPVGHDTYISWFPGARITAAEAFAGGLTIWYIAQHDPQSRDAFRSVEIVGTGMPFPSNWEVLATARDPQTQLVWHLVSEPWGLMAG
jgi:hypothetical protein